MKIPLTDYHIRAGVHGWFYVSRGAGWLSHGGWFYADWRQPRATAAWWWRYGVCRPPVAFRAWLRRRHPHRPAALLGALAGGTAGALLIRALGATPVEALGIGAGVGLLVACVVVLWPRS